jgi:hypothetical protein
VNKDTGAIRPLAPDEAAGPDEVELTEAQAEDLRPLSPRERLATFFGRGVERGKDRSASRPAPGTQPRVPPSVARTLATGDHHKARERKAAKVARRATRPHVKRHARSRAHRGHGK